MSRIEDKYKPALEKIKIPILTLDNNWHKLFTQTHQTPEVAALEAKLNKLLKKQGKNTTDIKKVKALKKKLMAEIMELADKLDETGDASISKKLDKNRRLVEECNEKLEVLQDDALDIPKEIDEVNYALMLKTMDVCYKRLNENIEKIQKYDDWIRNVRIELKKNVIRKQEKEADTYELYTYMHDIFGPDVIDIFDMHYNPEQFRLRKNEEEKKQEEGKSEKGKGGEK